MLARQILNLLRKTFLPSTQLLGKLKLAPLMAMTRAQPRACQATPENGILLFHWLGAGSVSGNCSDRVSEVVTQTSKIYHIVSEFH